MHILLSDPTDKTSINAVYKVIRNFTVLSAKSVDIAVQFKHLKFHCTVKCDVLALSVTYQKLLIYSLLTIMRGREKQRMRKVEAKNNNLQERKFSGGYNAKTMLIYKHLYS